MTPPKTEYLNKCLNQLERLAGFDAEGTARAVWLAQISLARGELLLIERSSLVVSPSQHEAAPEALTEPQQRFLQKFTRTT